MSKGRVGRNLKLPVSPASPTYAIRVCLFNCLVLSSDAFRMVAPRIAALDAAIKVKSLPVIPSRTSLERQSANRSYGTLSSSGDIHV